MLNYNVLSRKPLNFKSFTGLEVPEFDAVYTKIQESYTAYEEKRLHREDRKRKIGAGHPFKLPLNDRLVMLLMYHRLYVTSTLLGFLFNLGQSNVLKNIPIALGCMRPTDKHRNETDKLAIQARVNAIAFLGESIIGYVKVSGLNIEFLSVCCSQIYEILI